MTLKKFIISAILLSLGAGSLAQNSPERRPYVETICVPDHSDRIYRTGETASLRVEAYAGGIPLEGVWVHFKSGDELMKPEAVDSIQFHNGMAIIPIGTRTEPGFKTVSYSFTVAGQTYDDSVNIAFSPEEIIPTTPMPEDFDKFWQGVLSEAETIDLNPEITLLPQYCTEKTEVSKVRITVGPDGRNIYGYLARPKDGMKHPVLFEPPGGGTHKRRPSTIYADRGYIYLHINIHHNADNELSDEEYKAIVKPYDKYWSHGIETPESFYYKEVYAACSRCIDFLCSLPDWDGKNVGVTGGSQGGALSIVTAALNDKVTFCSAFYPALCDLTGALHGRAPGWPKYFLEKEVPTKAVRTLAYYDVVNFARKIKCPVFYSFGFNDQTCCPTSTYAAYNVIMSPKKLVRTFTNGHWRFSVTNEEAKKWCDSQCTD